VIDEYGGTIPPPLIIMVILWLAIIFASFGYRAPRNTIVTASFFLAALLISAAIYLILDMDTPSSRMTQASNVPFQRALAQLQR
jgi:cbb3-type cytochrome oxidase subunit 1